ncbi:F390 synthetase-related protein [Propionibacterium australiense]|nr:F390 synthetase-related protein [Propionibacterium australiense]
MGTDVLAGARFAARIARAAIREHRLRFTDRRALEAHQERLARRQIAWLAEHSPYTRERLSRQGLSPAQWRALEAIGKTEMMANFDSLNTQGLRLDDVLAVGRRAEQSRDFTPTMTGTDGRITVGLSTGTSGAQGVFIVSDAERAAWAGCVLPHTVPDWPRGLLRAHRVAFFLRAEGGLYRSVEAARMVFRFFDLLRPVEQLAAELADYGPTILVGPPSVLRAIADAGGAVPVERAISVAEVLEDDDRTVIESSFGPLVQVYQATEGVLALPCRRGQLHLNEAHLVVETEDLGDGLVSPIITDLRRRSQPMVRHRLNDALVLGGDCPCGQAARRVERIVGRCDDALLFEADGRTLRVWPDFVRAELALLGAGDYLVDQRSDGLHARHAGSSPVPSAGP